MIPPPWDADHVRDERPRFKLETREGSTSPTTTTELRH